MKKFEYDVALSFAGEDRVYVDKVANLLKAGNVKVFYDNFEKANLWGKDLYQHLSGVYKDKSQYTVIFISEHYKKKLWANHEMQSAQARAFNESKEYILPARFDDTEIPGVPQTIGYISLKDITPEEFVGLIKEKISYVNKNNSNLLKAEAFSNIIRNPQLFKAIMSGNDDLAFELLGKEGNLEEIFFKMFESGALD